MCSCGCNTCEIKGPLLTESKVKSLLSEGLQYHIDKKIPLFETVYRIGSKKHLSLIKEARKMYSRNVIDLCEEDEALIKTHLGEFALYEGVSIPLDLPMLEEEVNNSDLDNAIYRLENVYKYLDTEYKETRKGEKFIQINYIPVTSPQSQNPEFVNVRYNNDEDIEIIKNRLGLSVLNESYDYDEVAQSEFGMDYDQLGSGEKEWVRDEIDNMSMNESKYEKEETIQQTIDRLKARLDDPNDGMNVPFLTQKIKDLEKSLSEATVDYNFSKEELIRVIKQLKRGASTEIGMIKAFEKALGRELTDDEIRGFKLNEAELDEAEFKGKDVPLNKPKRGGSKAYYVYVRDPKTKKIKKVSFGSGGLRAKIKNKEARNAFAARHRCKDKKDRTKAGYWSCNLPRYAQALGLGANMNTFW